MKFIVFIVIIEVFAVDFLHRTLSEATDGQEFVTSTSGYSIWDYVELPSTTPWWSGLNVTTRNFTSPRSTTKYNPIANMSMSPQEVIDLIGEDMNKVKGTIETQAKKIFGETTPELNELVFSWLMGLLNKAMIDNNTTFRPRKYKKRTTINIHKLTTKFTEVDALYRDIDIFGRLRNAIDEYATNPVFGNIYRQGTKSTGLHPNDKKIPPSYQYRPTMEYSGTANGGPFTTAPGHARNPSIFAREVSNHYQHQSPSFQGAPGYNELKQMWTNSPLGPTVSLVAREPPETTSSNPTGEPTTLATAPAVTEATAAAATQTTAAAVTQTTAAAVTQTTAAAVTQTTVAAVTQAPSVAVNEATAPTPAAEPGATPATAAAVTEATASAIPPARQDYGHMLLPDNRYDMYPDGTRRPIFDDLVDEGTDIIIFGMTTMTTTTLHPMVSSLKKQMIDKQNGYFTTFVIKLFELIVQKDKHAAGRLFVAADMVMNDMERDGTLRGFGSPFGDALVRGTQLMSGAEPEIVQSQATIGFHMMQQRQAVISPELNFLLDSWDRTYSIQEGDDLLLILVDIAEYPANNLTALKVMKKTLKVILAPYYRLQGTDRLRNILNKVNDRVAKTVPMRRNDKRMTHYINRYNAMEKSDRSGIKFKDTHIPFIRKRKPIGNTIKKQTSNRHLDLRNKYRNEDNLRNVYMNMKTANHKRNIGRNGHIYEELLATRRFVTNIQPEKLRTFHSEMGIRVKPTSKKVMKRFEVQKTALNKETRNTDLIPDLAAKNIEEPKSFTPKSKYLAKPSSIKSRFESNRVMSELFSKQNSEERNLKIQLQDTMRHGNRQFIERRNIKNIRKKKSYDISDYSDNVLKSQIYKQFYKSAH